MKVPRLSRYLLTLILSLFSFGASAGHLCDSLAECEKLHAELDNRINELQEEENAKIQAEKVRQAPKVTGIAKNADGTIRPMLFSEALKYCETRGMHLPTAREFARIAAGMNADGISETKRGGYYSHIGARNAVGEVDNFYFNAQNYKMPEGDFGAVDFWTSDRVDWMSEYIYMFHGDTGNISKRLEIYTRIAVVCIRGN